MPWPQPIPAQQIDPTGSQAAQWPAGTMVYAGLGGGLYGLAVLRRPEGAPAELAVMDPETRTWTYSTIPWDGADVAMLAGPYTFPRLRRTGGQWRPG